MQLLLSKVRGFWTPGDGCRHTQHGARLAFPGLWGGLRLTPFVSKINVGMPSPSRAALMHWHHGRSCHVSLVQRREPSVDSKRRGFSGHHTSVLRQWPHDLRLVSAVFNGMWALGQAGAGQLVLELLLLGVKEQPSM